MVKFLFKFLFNRLTYGQLVELIYSNPIVQAHFKHEQLLQEQCEALIEPEPSVIRQLEVVTRLESDVYDYLEKQVSNTSISSNTSDIEAGFKLGVQHVLAKLRAGYVIPRSY